jgi:pimeloyl-ACP methyl ester carboxylesterase
MLKSNRRLREGRGLRARMLDVMGDFPGGDRRVSLDMTVMEERREGAVMCRKITFGVEPDDRCWAWLLIPAERLGPDAPPGPALLCLHQTTKIGKDEPAGFGGLPNLHYARELAQRGYATLSPDYPQFGDYRVDVYGRGYASATLKGIWNHMRAVDLLAGLPLTDPRRIGCIGHSLGGHNALFLAVFEPRLKAVVTSCGFTRFTWNDNEGRGLRGNLTDWSHAGYMPRIAERYACKAANMPFDFEDILAAIAPRALFINAPRDDFFRWEGVDECVELVAPLYARHGAPQRLVCLHPPGGHDFPAEVRQAAYRFLDEELRSL